MNQAVKWDYFTAYCWYEEDCKLCLDDRKKKQSHWALEVYDNQHHWLKDGLRILGSQGWELVAVQQAVEASGGVRLHNPSHWYVFKKPIWPNDQVEK
jgi:hypothetical protein